MSLGVVAAGAAPEANERRYRPSTAPIVNPERGFYEWIELVDANAAPGDLSSLASSGSSLAFSYLRLGEFVDTRIGADYLDALDVALGAVAQSGFKLILRIAYRIPDADADADGGGYGEPEATLSRMREHAGQLAPIFERHRAVVAFVQAGMVGPWGEWHSANGGFDTKQMRQRVLETLLSLVPTGRFVQLRNPSHIQELFPRPLPAADVFSSRAQARVGHHNDCFLASADDMGTYFPAERETSLRELVRRVGEYAPIGGETCRHVLAKGRTDCDQAERELRRYHWSYLNRGYFPPVIDRWQRSGCLARIRSRLGYRFVLSRLTTRISIGAGEALALQLVVGNEGYARLYNPRHANLILRDEHDRIRSLRLRPTPRAPFVEAGGAARRPLDPDDARHWLPPAGTTTELRFAPSLPDELPAGRYELLLHLPDPDPRLAGDPRYAIAMANEGVWESETGYNALGVSVLVLARSSH